MTETEIKELEAVREFNRTRLSDAAWAETEHSARECITHHHACDCRERAFSRVKAALASLVEEYEDRKCQFGSDCLWQKHESSGVLEEAKDALLSMG